MARIRIDLPEQFDFSTDIAVRFGDLNAGNHLAHENVLRLASEARLLFIKNLGYEDLTVGGYGYVVCDAAIVYKAQAFYGQVLNIEIAVRDFTRRGCEFIHRATDKHTGTEIARVKIGIVFFDARTQKSVDVPPQFRALFPNSKSAE
ncbi:MAG: thioesterase family protein [Dehalococcoidia bacterium]